MAKVLRSLAVLAVLALLAAATYGVWYARTPVKAAALPVEFEIREGIGMRGAARRLEQAGIDVGRKRFVGEEPLPFAISAKYFVGKGRDN